jgi:D-serine deaminase-like pyridoxal phosphate-dependent protein
LADAARKRGLEVRGVMGYEGHVVGIAEEEKRRAGCSASMALLSAAHRDVGGDLVSAGGTGTYACNDVATEIQAGSYALMDTAYSKLDLGFEQAFWVWATVISVSPKYAVLDSGLKAFGMDHGDPDVPGGKVWFCSDEHLTFAPDAPVKVGDRFRVHPAHVDPTVTYHTDFQVMDPEGETIIDRWPIDLRGW